MKTLRRLPTRLFATDTRLGDIPSLKDFMSKQTQDKVD
jgi:hypothetical protein